MLTVQSFTVSGFSMVRYSVKPAPTFPSAKYQVLLTGPVAVGDGVPVGEGDGLGDTEGEGVGEGEFVGDAVGDGVALDDGLGVGVGVAALPVIEKLSAKALVTETYCMLNVVAETVNWEKP